MSSESLGGAEGCDKWLGGATDLAAGVLHELTPENCFDVSGHWRVQAGPDSERGDIVVDFTGHELIQAAATQAKSVHTIAESLVFRHTPTGYVRLSGKNPTHGV